MKHEYTIPRSQRPGDCLCIKPAESSPAFVLYFFNIIPPSTPGLSTWYRPFRFPHQIPNVFIFSPYMLHTQCISSPLIWSRKKKMVISASHEAPQNKVTPKLLSLPSPYAYISSQALYSVNSQSVIQTTN